MAPFCDEAELAALQVMFKGNETAATAFCEKLDGMTGRMDGMQEGVNTFFLTSTGALVFIMHAGFAMVSGQSAVLPLGTISSMPCMLCFILVGTP
jgi:hypothetical protein